MDVEKNFQNKIRKNLQFERRSRTTGRTNKATLKLKVFGSDMSL